MSSCCENNSTKNDLHLLLTFDKTYAEHTQNPVKHLKWGILQKRMNVSLKPPLRFLRISMKYAHILVHTSGSVGLQPPPGNWYIFLVMTVSEFMGPFGNALI